MTNEAEVAARVANVTRAVRNLVGTPVLVMYYPTLFEQSVGTVRETDVLYLYRELVDKLAQSTDRKARNRHPKLGKLTVILHTYGGHPDTAYRLAQVIHKFADEYVTLIPYYAYSAGSLFCMGSSKIKLSPISFLTPFDIHYDFPDGNTIFAITVDSYLEFVRECKRLIERDDKLSTTVETELLGKLADQQGALNLGQIIRERRLTQRYAEKLLTQYMLRDFPEKHRDELKNAIVDNFVFRLPSHDFIVDFNIAQDLNLAVEELNMEETNKSMSVIDELDRLTSEGHICQYIGEQLRLPFFHLEV